MTFYKLLLSPDGLWKDGGLAAVRIAVGLLTAYHGWEIFSPELMAGYAGWDSIKVLPAPLFMVYFGKALELASGICLTLGLFTRLAAPVMALDMLFVCFHVGNGRFWYEDQHPFMFALFGLLFFFTGPGKWSLDLKQGLKPR